MPLSDYPAWELEPRKLSTEQIAEPMQVIHEFFNMAHLPQVRDMLWELLKITVTGNYAYGLSRREKTDLVYFYEQLEKMVEAAHLLHRKS